LRESLFEIFECDTNCLGVKQSATTAAALWKYFKNCETMERNIKMFYLSTHSQVMSLFECGIINKRRTGGGSCYFGPDVVCLLYF
jgi:hypothetical protein